MIVGGYVAADLNEPGVKAAQAVAVNEIYTQRPTRALVEKVGAEMQVVAGLNYRFTISMSGGDLLQNHLKLGKFAPDFLV